ncbi:unnamed protein product [Rotaria socialis]|uniref:Uncharacterized protein n=2 Tax=Rotaria socialis TaxID=392032 RepID=A0A821CE36_9BILA|nr:unnamed protein product [Rotaria socialis]
MTSMMALKHGQNGTKTKTTSGNGSDENLSGNSSNPATARNIKTDLESVPEIPDTGISKAKGLPTILQVIFVGITLAQQQRRQQRQQLVPHQRLRLPLRQQQRQQLRRQLQQQRPLRLQPLQQRQQLRRQLQQQRPLPLQPQRPLRLQPLRQQRVLLQQQRQQQLPRQLKRRLPQQLQQQLPPRQRKLRLLPQQLQQQLQQQPAKQQQQVTSAACPTGYVRTPSGSCVNLLIDFNNCGSIGYVCASSYTSCSNGACSGAPAVQLTGGVTVPGWGGTVNVDDAYVTLSLPFSISLYGYVTSSASVQSNGCVCLSGCSSAYTNGPLPSGSFSGPTAFGYWDDLYIYAGTSQSVYYGTTGTYPNRNMIFEFYMAHFSGPTLYYHFQIVFYESSPNIVAYSYFQSSDGGSSATIGVQSSGSGPSMTYSVDTSGAVPVGSLSQNSPTMTLTFNTNAGTYSSSG